MSLFLITNHTTIFSVIMFYKTQNDHGSWMPSPGIDQLHLQPEIIIISLPLYLGICLFVGCLKIFFCSVWETKNFKFWNCVDRLGPTLSKNNQVQEKAGLLLCRSKGLEVMPDNGFSTWELEISLNCQFNRNSLKN